MRMLYCLTVCGCRVLQMGGSTATLQTRLTTLTLLIALWFVTYLSGKSGSVCPNPGIPSQPSRMSMTSAETIGLRETCFKHDMEQRGWLQIQRSIMFGTQEP